MIDSNISVRFANFNYEFIIFQKKYKQHCQYISLLPKNNFIMIKDNAIKITTSFITEYLPFIKSQEVRNKILSKLHILENNIDSDKEYYRLCNLQALNNSQKIILRKLYYTYFISLFEIIGLFGDELSSTFMPNKSDRIKLFKYTHENSFYEEFTEYKSKVSKYISEFDIKNFDECFLYIIGFYYAYYLFIDSRSRILIEDVMKNILNIVLNVEIFKLINEDMRNLSENKKIELKKRDKLLHKSILKIFFRCNYSYSLYGIMPQIEENVNIDMTLI